MEAKNKIKIISNIINTYIFVFLIIVGVEGNINPFNWAVENCLRLIILPFLIYVIIDENIEYNKNN